MRARCGGGASEVRARCGGGVGGGEHLVHVEVLEKPPKVRVACHPAQLVPAPMRLVAVRLLQQLPPPTDEAREVVLACNVRRPRVWRDARVSKEQVERPEADVNFEGLCKSISVCRLKSRRLFNLPCLRHHLMRPFFCRSTTVACGVGVRPERPENYQLSKMCTANYQS